MWSILAELGGRKLGLAGHLANDLLYFVHDVDWYQKGDLSDSNGGSCWGVVVKEERMGELKSCAYDDKSVFIINSHAFTEHEQPPSSFLLPSVAFTVR